MPKKISSLPIGSKVKDLTWLWEYRTGNNYTGTSETQPVIWDVVAHEFPGYPEKSTTLVSRNILGMYTFTTINNMNYENSQVWKFLNGSTYTGNANTLFEITFYDTLSPSFKRIILKTDNNMIICPSQSNLTSFYTDNVSRIKTLGGVATPYWTSTNAGTSNIAAIINTVGGFSSLVVNSNCGVLPQVNISGDTLVFDTPDEDGVYIILHINSKYLIKFENKIHTLSENKLQEISLVEPLTKEDFGAYGISKSDLIKFKKNQYTLPPTEILVWIDSVNISSININYTQKEYITPKIELGIPEYAPYQLFNNPSISTYVEEDTIPTLPQISVAKSEVRYLVSKDKLNYEAYRDGRWRIINDIATAGMTAVEIQSIPPNAWSEWVGREAHKHTFDIKVWLYSENPDKPLLKNIMINYAGNVAPIITNPKITPDSIHTEFCRVTANIHDYEGDTVEYRILIKKAGESEFVVADDWILTSNNTDILKAYNKPYFNVGDNVIKLEVRDQRGAILEWTGNLVMTNQKPIMAYSYDSYGFISTIEDPDLDEISIQILINDIIVMDYSPYLTTPRQFVYEWDTAHTPFDQDSKITVNVKDSFDHVISEEFTITGVYKNLMFLDNKGNYYTSDKGDVLQWLNIPNLVSGQKSDPVKITLLNLTNMILDNVNIFQDNSNISPEKQLPGNVELKLSKSNDPFEPVDNLNIAYDMNHGDSEEFYVAIHTKPGRGIMNGEFSIKTEGSIKK